MRTITATEASRRFSDLLDAIEAGESVAVSRGGRTIAEIRPARQHTGRDLREALERRTSGGHLDDDFAADIDAARGMLDEQEDPWADA
jgi:antitoxin (DNA-binding transcriptional repressor) of toxin-antitoxin stability system